MSEMPSSTIKFNSNDIFVISKIFKKWKEDVTHIYQIEHNISCAKDFAYYIDAMCLEDDGERKTLKDIHFKNIDAKINFKINLHPHGSVSELIHIPTSKEIYATVLYDKEKWFNIFSKRYYQHFRHYSVDYYGSMDFMLQNILTSETIMQKEQVAISIKNSLTMEVDCSPKLPMVPTFNEILENLPSRYERAQHMAIKSLEKDFSNKNKLDAFLSSKKGKKAIELETIQVMMVLKEITSDFLKTNLT